VAAPGAEQRVYEPDAGERDVDADLALACFRLLELLYNQLLWTTCLADDHSSHAAILPLLNPVPPTGTPVLTCLRFRPAGIPAGRSRHR
jgi:hypothetical protein